MDPFLKTICIPLLLALVLGSCVSPADRARAAEAYAAYDPAKPFPESAFVESLGLRLHYRHWLPADASGQAVAPRGRILLVHGFGASSFSFRNQVPALLAAGWEVATVDHPPFGFSDKGTDYSRFDRGALLWAVPDTLGWEEPVVLLGHSLGGQYIEAMAEGQPARVRALVFLAGAVRGYTEQPGAPGLFGGASAGFIDSMISNWGFVRDTLGRIAGRPVPDDMVDGYIAPFQATGGSAALAAWSKAMQAQPALHPETVKAPALLVWGAADTVVPLSVGRGLADLIPGARLVVLPERGHVPHEMDPAEVNAPLLEFLAGLD
jgi:pimeloyl-ACP methyl ester carboxylesterase